MSKKPILLDQVDITWNRLLQGVFPSAKLAAAGYKATRLVEDAHLCRVIWRITCISGEGLTPEEVFYLGCLVATKP